MNYSKKFLVLTLLLTLVFNFAAPLQVTHAAGLDTIVNTLASSTTPTDHNGGLLGSIFDLLFNKILGPIFNIFGGSGSSSSSGSGPVKVTPLPPSSGPIADSGVLRGKTIVVDPGHGGSNPGAVGNGTRESDNNLAVGLKLRDKLTQAGAKVIMTRSTDRTVATEGSTLDQELQARVDIAQNNHADMFVSVHSNENPDSSIVGATTFYPSGRSPQLATEIQSALISSTQAVDKGTEPATFYVLRNTTMPSVLVEMGFVSNADEAAKLQDDGYRNKIAQGIFNGIVKYFQKS